MDTFYERAYSLISSQQGPRGVQHRRRARRDPRRVRPQRGRPADADGPPPGRRRRAVRHADLRRLGHARQHHGRACGPDAGLRPGLRRPDPRPRPHRPARTTRWSWSRASSAARPRSTARRPRPLAQGVQRRAGRRRHQAGLRSTASSNADGLASPRRDPIGPDDLATTVYHQLGIVADKELMAPGNRPIEIVDGGKVRKELLA